MISRFQIAYKNLLRKKARTLLTLVGIMLSSWVLVSLLGFNRGYESALNRDIDNMGYQLMVMAKGCPYEAATMMLQGGTGLRYIEQSMVDSVAREPEVDTVTPILMQAFFDPNKGESGGIAGYYGVDPATFPAMKPFFRFRQGGWFRDETAAEAVMGYEAAELEQREVGDMTLVPEKNVQLKVVGILERTGTQDDGTIFVPLKTLQKISGIDKITTIGIKVKKDADSAGAGEQALQAAGRAGGELHPGEGDHHEAHLHGPGDGALHRRHRPAHRHGRRGQHRPHVGSGADAGDRHPEDHGGHAAGHLPSGLDRDPDPLHLRRDRRDRLGLASLPGVTDVLVRRILPYAPGGGLVAIDARLSLVTLAVIVAVGLLSGLYPAWKAGRVRPLDSIRSEG